MQIVSGEHRASNYPVHFLRRVEIRKLNFELLRNISQTGFQGRIRFRFSNFAEKSFPFHSSNDLRIGIHSVFFRISGITDVMLVIPGNWGKRFAGDKNAVSGNSLGQIEIRVVCLADKCGRTVKDTIPRVLLRQRNQQIMLIRSGSIPNLKLIV